MRLLVFAVFMIIVAIATAIGSLMAGATFWTIILRVVIVLVALQVAYFVILMFSLYFFRNSETKKTPSSDTDRSISGSSDTAVGSQKN